MSRLVNETDQQLLAHYTRHRAEDAFEEIVHRHLDLVHSAALRQVRSTHLAEEVAQTVFTDLARNAHRLTSDTVLTAWLYQVTRRTAIDVVRRESRRQLREQVATELNAMNATAADWLHIEPLLDEAMSALDEPDRTAVLLRYFENKSLREVGQTLGTSDDAAQKRVSRAVDRLREFFAKRSISVGASGLAVVISANAVQAAPAGLAVSIASAAALTGTTLASAAALGATKAIAMTTLQKTLVVTTIAAAIGTGFYEARKATKLRDEVQALQRQHENLLEQNNQLQRERDAAVQQFEAWASHPTPSLVASQMRSLSSPNPSPSLESSSTNLMVRLLNGESPNLTNEQIEGYLKENRRNAASLLAAARATGDKAFLEEAMQKFPKDPRVAFEAVFRADSPEARRQWLESFKESAPDNALAGYLSALDHFKSANPAEAVQDLIAASGKSQFEDYSWDFVQNAEEAWRAAGYSEAETRMVATWQLLLPHAAELKQLHQNIMDLAKNYRQAGDEASAQAALQFNLQLGQQLSGSANNPLINQMVGLVIQRNALGALDPNSFYGTGGQTVAQRIEQLQQEDATIRSLVKQMSPLQQTMSQQDWITYNDRTRAFGEINAIQWLIEKYAQK